MDNVINQASSEETSDKVGKKAKSSDKRKQSLYLPDDLLQSLQEEAARLDRSLSWVVQRCVKLGLPGVKNLPSMVEDE